MTFTASRTPYAAQTPDRTVFDGPSTIPLRLSRLDTDAVDDDATLRRPGDYPSTRHGFRASWRMLSSTCKSTYQNNIGLSFIAIAGAFMSLMSTLVKMLNNIDPPVPMLELIFVRMVSIPWQLIRRGRWIMKVPDPLLGPQGVRGLLALRGVFGFIGLFGLYFSLQYLSVSDATVLQFLAPIFTAVAGALFLKEHFSKEQAFASLFSLAGVVLIAHPSFLFGPVTSEASAAAQIRSAYAAVTPAQRLSAVGYGMIGVLGATGAYTTIRAIGKRAHALHSVVAYSVQSVLVSSVCMLTLRTQIVMPTRLDWAGMLIGIAICGFTYQMLLTMGLQRETAGRGTMAVYVQIVYATINDFVFFRTTPTLLSVIGTIVIMSSAMYVAVSKENGPLKTKETILSQDHTLEQGLLENQDDGDEVTEGDTA
ncbi:hypothetical protein FOMPIDRAFT_1130587 [Fomitopsis schrenkii]|uniref:EamA domain-containing protein n=1 Tax=Fomitopsis schrenkii TaxID=2126942 RepID=S8F3I7_FOMSC|nr:hypothetical protein FOMPIDRAFT_1130587 [Fomitopsis schrenkii]